MTVIEFLDRILPGMDSEVCKQCQRIFEKQGIAFRLSSKVTAVDTSGNVLKVKVEPAAGGAVTAAVRHEGLRIGGERITTPARGEVFNPFTRALVGTVARASLTDVRRAIGVAKDFRSALTRYERYRICYRAAELLRARTEEIANLITAESGLCKKDSTYEVGRACDVFVFAGNAALTDDGQVLLAHARHLLESADEMETVLGRQSGAPRGLVRLGTSVAGGLFLAHRSGPDLVQSMSVVRAGARPATVSSP